ncbi:hypothetical protein J6590_082727 [Homalodisca vitripennis]|nr:hypothetical protein J6590_082727 [Homalodisca vitripennis]
MNFPSQPRKKYYLKVTCFIPNVNHPGDFLVETQATTITSAITITVTATVTASTAPCRVALCYQGFQLIYSAQHDSLNNSPPAAAGSSEAYELAHHLPRGLLLYCVLLCGMSSRCHEVGLICIVVTGVNVCGLLIGFP